MTTYGADWFSRRAASCRLHAIYLNQLRVYMEIAGEIVKYAAPWVKTAKAQLQATGCTGGSPYFTRRSASIRLRDQIESEDSRSCGSTTVLSAVAASALAGNCRYCRALAIAQARD
jgi:hypothetical protein